MTRVAKLFNLPLSDQRRLIQTGLLVIAFRIGLWVLPFRVLRSAVSKVSRRAKKGTETDLTRVGRQVVSVSRFVPSASCLTQALAAQVLLLREGFSPTLQIGVARDSAGAFKAHAWVECEGKTIVGDFTSTALNYAPLLPPAGEFSEQSSSATREEFLSEAAPSACR